MTRIVLLTPSARDELRELKRGLPKRHRAVSKALRLMGENLRHPGLNTHEYSSLKGPSGEKVYEAYAENKTPGAYRIFWFYGPGQDQVTVFAITPHP